MIEISTLNNPKVFERLHAVMARTGKAKSTIYADVKEGRFPAPIKIGPRMSAWLRSDIDAWFDEQVARHNSQKNDTPTSNRIAA